jgi:hypothetical protein
MQRIEVPWHPIWIPSVRLELGRSSKDPIGNQVALACQKSESPTFECVVAGQRKSLEIGFIASMSDDYNARPPLG